MKEETPSKKLPPKMSTPTKMPNDEILSSLLRINNFDSISSLKDESLDIDLSACVSISADLANMIGGNSLSSTDFWRVLDESAQNSQLEIAHVNDERASTSSAALINIDRIKVEPTNSFKGTFLRPEPPSANMASPIKKFSRPLPAELQQHNHRKTAEAALLLESKKSKLTYVIKEEPPEQLLADSNDDVFPMSASLSSNKSISQASFKSFLMSKMNTSPNAELLAPTMQTTEDECVENGVLLIEPQQLYKCLNCNLVLTGKEEYATHEAASHRIRFKCAECERDYDNETGLKKHMKTHRGAESRKDAWKKCPDCGKCLKLGSMWMHRKIHSENKKYGCDICGQKFVQKINLTHHARIHTAEKPYECPECQKRFQERSHLQRHQKYHAQTRSYRCDKCGKMYKTERCLKVHNLVHLEQRPFACTVCSKSFISNSKLKQHSNIHTGERPFKCNYCPRDFTNFPNWLKHTRRRHKVDHKTGEHLENIPSYCSKKSTKTAKPKKAAASAAANAVAGPSTSTEAIGVAPELLLTPKVEKDAPKPPARRKKKQAAPEAATSLSVIDLSKVIAPTSASDTLPELKVMKVKRERKQPTPKQVQKVPPVVIKTENLTPKLKVGSSNFPDLHCLSITSAEELIMEQALEMEECGLYEAPVSAVGTDNAISSEAAAVLQFKIKNEFPVEPNDDEEFMSMNEVKNPMLCTSLESSPFSSPASVELAPKAQGTTSELRRGNTTYYMPSYSLATQSAIVSSIGNVTARNSSAVSSVANHNSATQQTQSSQTISSQALINHFYLPMPLLVQPNQVLPSVDTLLFSTHANPSFFRNKQVAQATAQQRLT